LTEKWFVILSTITVLKHFLYFNKQYHNNVLHFISVENLFLKVIIYKGTEICHHVYQAGLCRIIVSFSCWKQVLFIMDGNFQFLCFYQVMQT